MKSPCVRHCCLNDLDVCIGCFRTLDEICQWATYTEQEREQILEVCNRRRQQAKHKPRTKDS